MSAAVSGYENVPVDAARVELLLPKSANKAWPMSIETPAEPWAYAAYFPIPPRVRRVSNAALRICVSTAIGEPWIGLLTRDQADFICRSAVSDSSQMQEIVFSDLNLRDASKIVIENGAEFGSSSVTIQLAEFLVPSDSPELLPTSPPTIEIAPAEVSTRARSGAGSMPSRSVRLGKHRFVVYGVSESDMYFESIQDNFEPEFQSFCEQYIDCDAICVDIGANIGMKALFLSRHASKGRVVAIEAAPGVARCLEKNIAANGASNVDVVQAAIGDRVGSVQFAESSAWGHIAQHGIEVPMLTLPEVMQRVCLSRLDFIKIDVEGFEFPILKNAYDLITRHRTVVLFEFNSWCQLAFADVNPKDFLTWLFRNFAYVGILRSSPDGYDVLEEVREDQLLYVLHDNLIGHGCVSDLVVTNARERL